LVWTFSTLNCVAESLLDIEPTSDGTPRGSLQKRQLVELLK